MAKLDDLFDAIRNQELDRVKKILKPSFFGKKIDVNKRDLNSRTALMYAAKYGGAAYVRLLLEHGAKVNMTDKNKTTALNLAAGVGDTESCQLLLDAGAKIDNSTMLASCTPLLDAVLGNHIETTRLLLDRGADVNKSNISNKTPLFYAVDGNNPKMVQLLLEYNADPNATTEFNEIALIYAVGKHKNLDIVRLLIAYGTKMDAKIDEMIEIAGKVKATDIADYLKTVRDNPMPYQTKMAERMTVQMIAQNESEFKNFVKKNVETIQQMAQTDYLVSVFKESSYEKQKVLYPVIRYQITKDVRLKIEDIMRSKREKERVV